MKTIEEQAREAAYKWWDNLTGIRPSSFSLSDFATGYLAHAKEADQELRELRLLAEEQLTTLRKLKSAMLSDTRDAEIAELRARVAELEGMVPKWLYMRAGQPSPEYVRLLSLGWTDAISSFPNDYPKNPMCWQLMVPPIPLPEGTEA